MIITFDKTFFALHYFSSEENVLAKTKRILINVRKLGNKGLIPTIVLGEFYALTHKKAGRDIAERYFNELVNSGLIIVDFTKDIAKQAGVFRHKYEEKFPWGDCIIAAAALINKAEVILTEDTHFKRLKEVKAETR